MQLLCLNGAKMIYLTLDIPIQLRTKAKHML